jgi:type IX secretion system PorP/SprF family membrane protein
MNIKIDKLVIIMLLMMIGTKQANAQLSGFHAGYFENEYLSNPAMAGMQEGLNLNLGYQQQWTTVPGAPKLQNLTADYSSGNNVGLGINVNSDQAGLISRTRVMGTYAYHLPVNGDERNLNFGLSLGINDTYIDYSKIVGDQGDVEAESFNSQNVYLDGDFGMSYTSERLTIQGAVPNLRSVFFNNDQNNNLEVDRATFFSAVSYKILFSDEENTFCFEPKLAYRGIKGFDNILDVGANMDMRSYHINVSGIYHTNQTVTLGAGLKLDNMDLLFAYTNNTGPLRTYAANTFEFGVKLKLFNKYTPALY